MATTSSGTHTPAQDSLERKRKDFQAKHTKVVRHTVCQDHTLTVYKTHEAKTSVPRHEVGMFKERLNPLVFQAQIRQLEEINDTKQEFE